MNTPSLHKLLEVVQKIRHPEDGCPWDLKQDHQSLLKYLIEESYEYIQAVDEKDSTAMKEELGDVLFQVVLHSQIASEENSFTFEEVANSIAEKMIRRHPHVFEDKNIAQNSEEVIENWNKIKAKEKEGKKKCQYYFSDSDAYAPALLAAKKIGVKSKKINFDWENSLQVWEKVKEELQEVEVEINKNNKDKIEEELGDLLFSIAQFARHLDIDPEKALFMANKKFINRIQNVEKLLIQENTTFQDSNSSQLEEKWKQVKSSD